jgi:hypothetical protein
MSDRPAELEPDDLVQLADRIAEWWVEASSAIADRLGHLVADIADALAVAAAEIDRLRYGNDYRHRAVVWHLVDR